MTLGYVALIAIFLGMVALLFVAAFAELQRPKDPGPLPIDVHRDIEHRWFARKLRELPSGDVASGYEVQPHLAPRMIFGAPSGPGSFMMSGDGDVPDGGFLDAFVCDGVATIGADSTVADHADGARGLVVAPGGFIGGRATSASWILLQPGSDVRYAAAPQIMTDGPAVPDDREPVRPWDGTLDMDLEWLLAQGMPLDQALRSLFASTDSVLDGVGAVRALESRTGLGAATVDLAGAMNLWWLAEASGWYLGAATARILGDIVLPAGAVVPFHLIVDGTLVAREGVHFHGGVSAGADAVLFEGCRVEGSLTAKGSVLLGDRVSIGECVSAGTDATVGRSVLIGSGRHGGLAATGTIVLGAGVRVTNKVYADGGIRVEGPVVTSLVPATPEGIAVPVR